VFASVTLARVNLDRVDDVAPLYGRLLPQLEAAPGWRGVYVVIDRASGDGLLLGLWDTEGDAKAFEASGTFQRILDDYPPGLLASAPSRKVGEVVFRARRADEAAGR
jgi:hypothetical protein